MSSASFLIDIDKPPSTTPRSPWAAFAQFFANGTGLRRNISDSALPFTCGWRIVNSHIIPRDYPSCYDSLMRNLAVLFIHFIAVSGSVARSWRDPFPHCGVASPQAPAPDLDSLPETISQPTRVGPDPRWLDGILGATNSSAPFRNCTEAFDIASTFINS
jgi:hypothetical protein